MNRVRRDRASKPLSWISEQRRKLSELGGMLGVVRREGMEADRDAK